jgi:predicted phosphate transport protein (TIGR00153 family)
VGIFQLDRIKVDFFAGFEEAALNNIAGAVLLDQLCRDFRDPARTVAQLHELEHKGDEITHRMYASLNRVFMPPLDREDIIAIATGLDDVMDHIYESADAMVIYNVATPTTVACSLATIIVECTEVMGRQLPNLRSRARMRLVQDGVVEIHRLENQADTLLRQGIMDLFHHPHDSTEVIAWSRIYETMEHVTDDSEEVADVLRGLVIKHA